MVQSHHSFSHTAACLQPRLEHRKRCPAALPFSPRPPPTASTTLLSSGQPATAASCPSPQLSATPVHQTAQRPSPPAQEGHHPGQSTPHTTPHTSHTHPPTHLQLAATHVHQTDAAGARRGRQAGVGAQRGHLQRSSRGGSTWLVQRLQNYSAGVSLHALSHKCVHGSKWRQRRRRAGCSAHKGARFAARGQDAAALRHLHLLAVDLRWQCARAANLSPAPPARALGGASGGRWRRQQPCSPDPRNAL